MLQAANGLEGLAAIEKAASHHKPFHLILCDVHMPRMDGLGFLLEKPLRDLAPGVPVVMITAGDTDPRLLRAIAAGAQGYISKPFTVKQVRAILCSVIGSAGEGLHLKQFQDTCVDTETIRGQL